MHPGEQGSFPANGFGHLADTPDTHNSGRVDTMGYDDDTDSTGPVEAAGQDDDTEQPDMSEMQRLLDEQGESFKSIKRGDVVEGQVVRIDPEEILVDIGLKSEGVLSTKELPGQGYGSLAELKVGDNVLVYVMQPETPEGHAVVSIRRARLERQWRIAQEQYERGELLEAEVIDHNKGGLIVNLEGIRGFVPISQILNLKREDTADNAETQTKLQAMMNRRLQLKIIEINRNRNRLILSERLAVQEWRQRRREELLNELEVGEVRRGVVSNLANFGAFVDLGGADGLVHISQLAWSRVNHPSEVLKVGQEVEVQVLSVDKEKKKIALSIKRAEVDPWTTVEQRYHPDQLVKGTITKIAPFGAFARIEDGIEGLIHLSELPAGMQEPKTALHEGQEVTVRILRIDAERRRLGLSVRQALEGAEAGGASAAEGEGTEVAEPMNGRAEAPAPAGAETGAGAGASQQRSRPTPAPAEEPQTAFAAAWRAAQANQERDQASAAADASATVESAPAAEASAMSPADTAVPTPEPAASEAAAPEAAAPDATTSEATAPEATTAPAAAPEATTPDTAAPEAATEATAPEATADATTQPAEASAEPAVSAEATPSEAAPAAEDTQAAGTTDAAEGAADIAAQTPDQTGEAGLNGAPAAADGEATEPTPATRSPRGRASSRAAETKDEQEAPASETEV